jgi:hypothetical protein
MPVWKSRPTFVGVELVRQMHGSDEQIAAGGITDLRPENSSFRFRHCKVHSTAVHQTEHVVANIDRRLAPPSGIGTFHPPVSGQRLIEQIDQFRSDFLKTEDIRTVCPQERLETIASSLEFFGIPKIQRNQ